MNYDRLSAETKGLLYTISEDIMSFEHRLIGLNSTSYFSDLGRAFQDISQKLRSVSKIT